MDLQLERPLVFFDLETTGLNTLEDRIIEICCIKLMPDGERITKTRRVKPGIPISAESSTITGIYDDDVKDEPSFAQLVKGIDQFFDGCDISGYNILGFDIKVLSEEYKRVGMTFSLEGRNVIDVQRIFHKREPRNLEAALRFYCGEELEGAHAAENDVLATIKVLEGQVKKYDDLAKDSTGLAAFCRDDRWVDLHGRLHWNGGDAVIGFGIHKGKSLQDMVEKEKGYLSWMINKDFPDDTKEFLRKALKEGIFPVKEQEPEPSGE